MNWLENPNTLKTTVEIHREVTCSAFYMAVRLLPVSLLVIMYGFMSRHFRPHRKMAEKIIQ
jgi:hypothetical protein